MKKLITILLLAISTAALSVPLVLTTATERTNGAPLPLSEIAWHEIDCGDIPGLYVRKTFVAGALLPETIYDHSLFMAALQVGVNYCVARTVDTEGRISGNSEEFVFNVDLPAPKPPTVPAGMVIDIIL